MLIFLHQVPLPQCNDILICIADQILYLIEPDESHGWAERLEAFAIGAQEFEGLRSQQPFELRFEMAFEMGDIISRAGQYRVERGMERSVIAFLADEGANVRLEP